MCLMQVLHNKFLHLPPFYYADIQTGRLHPNDCNVSETYNRSLFGRLDRFISMFMSYKRVTYEKELEAKLQAIWIKLPMVKKNAVT